MGEIICRNVRVERGNFTLSVDELRIGHSEKVALLGENGCGKTTLLQALAGLLPARGEILINGKNWARLNARQRAEHMAFLPQETGVLFNLTVEELLELALGGQRLHSGESRAAVLAATEMDAFLKRAYHSLSGGEQRRAMLARVFCRDVEFMLLDEPTSSLDMRHSVQFMRHAAGGSSAVIAALHDINLAVRYYDRFLLMKAGRILFDRRKEDLHVAELEEIYGLPLRDCGDHFVPGL